MTERKFTTAHYAAIVSTLAFAISIGSLIYAKRSYELSFARDQRELMDKKPAIDIQMRPQAVSVLSVTISILNRSDVNISPLDIVAHPSIEAGELYFSSDRQSVDKLNSSLSLTPMGIIAPKGNGTIKATLSGVTDGKTERFRPGLELQFSVRTRFADQQDAVEQSSIVRRILPATGSPPLRPTPEMFVDAVVEAKKAQQDQQILFYGLVVLGFAAVLGLIFYFRRLWLR
jgi:hypothetical protein